MTLSGLDTLLIAVFMLLLMLGMGATLDLANFRAVLREPKALGIGLLSQFGWMPAIALGLSWIFGLDDRAAAGLVIMGCSSGGTSSNFFSYLAKADLALSISMTVTSTIVGVVMIPLVLFVYTTPFRASSPELAIPYASIGTTLFAVLVPVAIGIAIRTRSEKIARHVERIGTYAGFAVLGLVFVAGLVRDGDILLEIDWQVYVTAILLGPIGFVLGALFGRTLGLAPPQLRAVSLETGIQNAPLALGIVLLSFNADVVPDVLAAPMLYGVLVVPCSGVAAWYFSRNAAAA